VPSIQGLGEWGTAKKDLSLFEKLWRKDNGKREGGADGRKEKVKPNVSI